MGHTIVETYTDEISGKNDKRYNFQRMMQDASKRKFDLLIFWSMDRLSREGVLQTLSHLQRLTDYGVAYKSYTEQYLDSCGIFKDAVISILATVAKQERIRLGERVKAGMARSKAQGLKMGRKPIAVLKGIDPRKVREMRSKGMSLRAVGKRLGISAPSVYRIEKGVSESPLPPAA